MDLDIIQGKCGSRWMNEREEGDRKELRLNKWKEKESWSEEDAIEEGGKERVEKIPTISK